MLTLLLRVLVRGLLRLRYRIRVSGLEEVAARGMRGILFLANHPALIDPVILVSELHRRFAPRPLADRDQINVAWWARWASRRARVLTMPDPTVHREAASRQEVEQALAACVEALRRGENVLIYPAGHICRQRYESLAGASGVETILRRLPEARVVLVRTRGLWGSMFSRASGQAPSLARGLRKAVLAILANGVFWSPRREVSVTLHEPSDLPRAAGRAVLNRYLETFFNQDAPPHTYVPYTIWERGGTRVMPEPALAVPQGDSAEVPAATRDQVLRHLRELTGRDVIREDDLLANDLGLDSLALVDLGLWLEAEFGFALPDGVAVRSVRDLLLAARGNIVAAPAADLEPVPAAWFAAAPSAAPARLPAGQSIAEVFLNQARQGPERAILADQTGGVKTYRDAIAAIEALRPDLARLPGTHVGIMLPASTAAGVAYLAALFAEKTPVMANWTVGIRNLTHALDLLQVRSVLTSARLVERIESQTGSLEALRERFVYLEDLGRRLSALRKARAWARSRLSWRALRAARVSDAAVVLFTSGSESLPKAVPLTHANLLTNMRDVCRAFPFRRDDRLLGILPPFHSFGLTCTVLLPLCAGVPAVYHPNPTEGGMLARLVEAYRVTLLAGTPTFINGIARAARGRELDSLRAAITGAEKCPASLYELMARRWPQLKLVEGYGVTECSPVISLNDARAPRAGAIGKVVASLEWALQDVERGGRAAPGRPGMLLVRGPSVFGGYLNYDGPSPFVEFEGKTWYRTGDLVSAGEDGVLTFVGRLKRFVKLGGEMISLPAIEEVLARHYAKPSDEGPVLAVESMPQELNPELVLFTVLDLDRGEVNQRIREAGLSPLHNIRALRKLDRIPTLGTGKTDYRALKDMLGAK